MSLTKRTVNSQSNIVCVYDQKESEKSENHFDLLRFSFSMYRFLLYLNVTWISSSKLCGEFRDQGRPGSPSALSQKHKSSSTASISSHTLNKRSLNPAPVNPHSLCRRCVWRRHINPRGHWGPPGAARLLSLTALVQSTNTLRKSWFIKWKSGTFLFVLLQIIFSSVWICWRLKCFLNHWNTNMKHEIRREVRSRD